MSKIDKKIAEKIVSHLIDISNNQLLIEDDKILAEKDEALQEIFLGLKHLHEDLEYSKQQAQQATAIVQKKNKLLLEQNTELEHFAYIISHDLKAPLLSIHTLASFIEEDIDDDKQAVFEHLKMLKERITKMDGLIEGILEFSKIGMTKSKKEIINLNTLLPEIYDGFYSPNNFQFEILNKLPILKGVKSQFVQLFSNLISNAIKYNDKDQGHISIDYKDLNTYHEFSFKDNGPGISKKYHEKIFIVFQTLGIKDSYKNTGIGLSIVKKIITNLEGTIHLDCDVDLGSKFIIQLPKKILKINSNN